jgi:tetratricopeptide (TPR) repeat protein
MRTDAYGLPVTTGSAEALDQYDRGARGLLSWDAAALDCFTAALARDPTLALAHAGAAICHFLEERFKEARAAAEAARAAASTQTRREQGHVAAVGLLIDGRPIEAEQAMREHLRVCPRDLVVFQRLYFVLFWRGGFPEMLELTRDLIDHYAGDAFMLGLHAFALEEGGDCDEAIRVAERAIALDARNAWGVHALAHALYEKGASDAGLTTLPPAIHPCTHLGWFRNHLLWHLALMHLALGRYDRVRALSRRVFERQPSSIAGDLHDSISLLWRRDLFDGGVGDAWRPFGAIARERLNRQGLLFHAVHLAMALAAAGDWETATRQRGMLRDRAAKDATGVIGEVVIPLVDALHGFVGGHYARTIELMEPLRFRIIEIGGSRAQRDVFHDTLLEACFRAGDLDRAERLLAERIQRRPDHYWTARRSGAA